MKLIKITWQMRNDFCGIIECENCHDKRELKSGYDDDNYHRNVIPKMKCDKCGLSRLDIQANLDKMIKE